MSAAAEGALRLIVIEAVTNVVRHAAAHRAQVSVARVGDRLVAEVSDDGTGIGPSAVPGIGSRSMRERAAELGGTVETVAAEPRGTTVRVVLPVPVPLGDDVPDIEEVLR
jgi:signal transduction histidine kinase